MILRQRKNVDKPDQTNQRVQTIPTVLTVLTVQSHWLIKNPWLYIHFMLVCQAILLKIAQFLMCCFLD